MPNLKELLQKNFFTGLLVLAPIVVIFWIARAFLGLLWDLFGALPLFGLISVDGETAIIIKAAAFLGTLAILAVLTSVLGWFSKQYLGQQMLEIIRVLVQKIPILGTIYSSLDQLLKTLAPGGGGQQFSRVVYIEYPRKDCWAVAFVTGAAKGRNLPPAPAGMLNCFVPTVPNPTSGFHLIVPEADVRESKLTVEEAFKTILSLGIAQVK
ncbi:MAG: DUF502 domain-containing protein [Bacteriovoracia bacterium]